MADPNDINKQVGRRVASARKAAHVTQERLADLVGIQPATLRG